MKNITVYCGGNLGAHPKYKEAAKNLSIWIANNKCSLVYGGGKIGLMGVVGDTVIENGGKTIGIMPQFLVDREQAHDKLDEMHIVDDMSIRKKQMLETGNIFIALPGGPGTLEEITEAITAAKLGIYDIVCILFNVDGYYDNLLNQYDKMVDEGFLSKEDRSKIQSVKTVEELNQYL